MTNSNGGEVTI